jgi:hypothetical protein
MVARAPAWSRDELILALDLFFRVGKARQHHPDVVTLSQILRSAHGGDLADRSPEALIASTLSYRTFLGSTPRTAARE